MSQRRLRVIEQSKEHVMSRLPMLLTSAIALAFATTATAQTATSPNKPTKVVARSGRLVTARTSNGGTQSFNCKKPENKDRKVCRK